MNEKIIQFLKEAGFEGVSAEPAALQLLRYFESEYDVNLLYLLEQEWVNEQIEREFTPAHFQTLRAFIDDDYLEAFDDTLVRIDALGEVNIK